MGEAGLGFRALKGGAVVVGVALEGDEPRLVASSFLATAAAGERLSLEPYQVAYEMARGADGAASAEAVAAVARGRARQDELAALGLEEMLRGLREAGRAPVVASLLVNRAGWVSDLLSYSLAFADHPPVAEGLAVRDALRAAFGACGLEFVEEDETSLPTRAAAALGRSEAEIEAVIKALGAGQKPWRKEQKRACLAAWLALAVG